MSASICLDRLGWRSQKERSTDITSFIQGDLQREEKYDDDASTVTYFYMRNKVQTDEEECSASWDVCQQSKPMAADVQ